MAKTVSIPRLSLVLMVGASGSGKSAFAARHFAPTEVVSTDRLRAMIDDDENSQSATNDAFEIARLIIEKRLTRGRMTVLDATSVTPDERRSHVKLAQKHHAAAVAIVLNPPKDVLQRRLKERTDRGAMSPSVVNRQSAALRKDLDGIRREGFYRVVTLEDPAEIDAVEIERERMRADRTDEGGPFDIIGDVNGCVNELRDLLSRLGYEADDEGVHHHAEGRRAIFLGNIVGGGPDSLGALRIVMSMVEAGTAECVPGSHEDALLGWLKGRSMTLPKGALRAVAQFDEIPEAEYAAFKKALMDFISGLESHFIFDAGRLVVAHAGMPGELAGRMAVRRFAIYGESKTEYDGFAPTKAPLWAQQYRARAKVVYGHHAVETPKRVHNTLNINTGVVYGGRLTALRYPEGEEITVEAAETYVTPTEPRREPKARRGGARRRRRAGAKKSAADAPKETKRPAPDAGDEAKEEKPATPPEAEGGDKTDVADKTDASPDEKDA